MKPLDLQAILREEGMDAWAERLPEQFAAGLDKKRYGDIPRWQQVIDALPELKAAAVDFTSPAITIEPQADFSSAQRSALEDLLKGLMPWRKGPYSLHGVYIDTEWRSDWKWQRIVPHISSLQDRLVLDIGCGNGYHCWRMLGEGARRVIGIDPMPLFLHQFAAVKHFTGEQPVDLVPIGVEQLPAAMQAFDTVFSMGVLYHRRSPIDHLYQLKDALRPGGELVLETLVIAGDEQAVLLPKGRYARMRNVWFLPSTEAMMLWLQRCGFENVRLVDVNVTSTEEQRATDWMRFESLADCLQKDNPELTVEGYPAPRRAVFIARKPG